jgi:hypothetical protein
VQGFGCGIVCGGGAGGGIGIDCAGGIGGWPVALPVKREEGTGPDRNVCAFLSWAPAATSRIHRACRHCRRS